MVPVIIAISSGQVEILALDKVVERLKKEKSLKFILHGERPGIDKANEERFFEQLKDNVDEKKYGWIKGLYDQVSRREEFRVGWGRGRRWFTMRFYVRKWDVDPMSVQGNGTVWVGYKGNYMCRKLVAFTNVYIV
jgi:hypothetical protein